MEHLSVAEFIDKFYKSERLNNEPGRRDRIIADREKSLRETGAACVSRHESVTGSSVYLYSPTWNPKAFYIAAT